MERLLFLTALIYCCGDPGFDGYPPAALDEPLRAFHHAIDKTARDVRRMLVVIDNAAPKLRGLGDQLSRVGEAPAPR